MAEVVVRNLVRTGVRKGPSDLLVMEDWVLDRWYAEEARRYLLEQKARHYQPLDLDIPVH